jgi:hypothetical protein
MVMVVLTIMDANLHLDSKLNAVLKDVNRGASSRSWFWMFLRPPFSLQF